ncbi:MAG: hypothetical protein JKY01_12390 [Pseudomonadales bacterium]|nr:hypothetical protein [Pseudomonadales bacterium]
MAKAASPVRLQDELMKAATTAGRRQHRSAAEQIEYWASLGRSVSKDVDPDSLLAVSTGLSRLQVVPVNAPAVDADDVFSSLERDRETGGLAASVVSPSTIRYQASSAYPDQLEQIDGDGTITIGQFSMGEFIPMERE